MTYNFNTATGSLVIPDNTKLIYKNLDIIGFSTKFWNEPIQSNFIKLADLIDANKAELESQVANVDLSAYYTKDETYNKTEVESKIVELSPPADLSTVYLKTETYNQSEIDTKIGAAGSYKFYEQTTAPTDAKAGDVWHDTDVDGVTAIYVTIDGVLTWVEI